MNKQTKLFDQETQSVIDASLDAINELKAKAVKLEKRQIRIEKQLNAQLATLRTVPNPTTEQLEMIAKLEALGFNPPPKFDNTNAAKARKENSAKKHAAIKKEFDTLYNVKRLRKEDCLLNLSQKYNMSVITIKNMLSKERPPKPK